MPDLITQLEYNDPLVIISRTGNDQDPYVRRTDSLPIINGCITLFEIPSTTKRVQISDMLEVDQSYFEQKKQLAPNEFLVHYQTGMIQFHPTLEGTTKLCTYYGKGLIMYPASRIYAMVSRHPDVLVTLQDYIDEIELKLTENTSLVQQITASLAEMKATTQQAKLAIKQTAEAIDATNEAAAFARAAYVTTKLVWKEPVQSDKQLYSTYPHPNVGWTVQTTNDGKRYRFDGSNWVLIDIFGSNLQTVNENKDGLMSIADYLKLKSFPDTLTHKTIVFSFPDAVQGVIENSFSFPFKGEIVSFYATCESAGETPTTVSIERTRNMNDWTEITNRRLTFQPNQKIDDGLVTFHNLEVRPRDKFRLHMNQQGFGFYNLTANFIIKVIN